VAFSLISIRNNAADAQLHNYAISVNILCLEAPSCLYVNRGYVLQPTDGDIFDISPSTPEKQPVALSTTDTDVATADDVDSHPTSPTTEHEQLLKDKREVSLNCCCELFLWSRR
jgi:hypothetical protein